MVDLVQLDSLKIMPLASASTDSGIYMSINGNLQDNEILTAKALPVQFMAGWIDASFIQNSGCPVRTRISKPARIA